MYTSSNLIVYYEKEFKYRDNVHSILTNCNVAFREFYSLKLLFAALKNPKNHIIIALNNKKILQELENIAPTCFDYQNRLFVILNCQELKDCFFENYCLANQLKQLELFIQKIIKNQHIATQHQTSKLLHRLVSMELIKLDISTKYIGFNYLVGVLVNTLSNNFYANSYIDLFTNIASENLETIDTVERDVRHMLRTTWKNSTKFRDTLQSYNINKPNAKNILQAIIKYFKKII